MNRHLLFLLLCFTNAQYGFISLSAKERVRKWLISFVAPSSLEANNKSSCNMMHLILVDYAYSLEKIKRVLEHEEKKGHSINTIDCYGNTALYYACIGERVDLIKWLLEEKQAAIYIANKQGYCPFHYIENDEILAIFIKNHPETINIPTADGFTLLDLIEEKLLDDYCTRHRIQKLEWCARLLQEQKAKHRAEL